MKKVVLIPFLLIVWVNSTHGQFVKDFTNTFFSFNEDYEDTVWTFAGDTYLDSTFHKWRMELMLDTRYTIGSYENPRNVGLRYSLVYRRVNRFGFGIYNFGNGVGVDSIPGLGSQIDTAILDLSYFSLFYERILFFNPRWELSVTGHVGSGSIKGQVKEQETEFWRSFVVRDVRPMEFSTSLYYHVTWWLSVGGGFGYRFMNQAPGQIQHIYDAPIAIFKFRIRPRRLVLSIWNKEVKDEY